MASTDPLEALFTIKVGAARMLPLERNEGFVVVRLDKILPKDPNSVPQLLMSTRAGRHHIFTMGRDGRNVRQVTRAGNNYQPDWSRR